MYAALALIYLLVPIAVILVFSFNNPKGRFNFIWQGFSLDAWKDPFAVQGMTDALVTSLEMAALSTIVATVLGTLTALALVRYEFSGRAPVELLHLHPAGHARGGARRGAALAVPQLGHAGARLRDDPDRARDVQPLVRGRSRCDRG